MDEFDGLFILGGPMNVYGVEKYPWLALEQCSIARAIVAKKRILGVCFGAQLLAVALGGSVSEMLDKEIGWFPVELTPAARKSSLFDNFPDKFTPFHWHGHTFSIPPGADHVATSEACDAQAFVYARHVVGLQFHLECDEASIAAMIEHGGDDLCGGEYIQDPYTLKERVGDIPIARRLLLDLLDRLAASETSSVTSRQDECCRSQIDFQSVAAGDPQKRLELPP